MESTLTVMRDNMTGLRMRTPQSMDKLSGHMSQQKVRTVAFKRMVKGSSIDGTGMLIDVYA